MFDHYKALGYSEQEAYVLYDQEIRRRMQIQQQHQQMQQAEQQRQQAQRQGLAQKVFIYALRLQATINGADGCCIAADAPAGHHKTAAKSERCSTGA